ncbi:hypothetical protein [Nocardia thraciensis]
MHALAVGARIQARRPGLPEVVDEIAIRGEHRLRGAVHLEQPTGTVERATGQIGFVIGGLFATIGESPAAT